MRLKAHRLFSATRTGTSTACSHYYQYNIKITIRIAYAQNCDFIVNHNYDFVNHYNDILI